MMMMRMMMMMMMMMKKYSFDCRVDFVSMLH